MEDAGRDGSVPWVGDDAVDGRLGLLSYTLVL